MKTSIQYDESKPIGSFSHEWRRRFVNIYDHPTDANQVVTVGLPFDGGEKIVCAEPRSEFARWIGRFRARCE